jgi:peptidoglycan/xylan/chitin deacetylase (PgdA/CDA1 family)
MPHLGLSALTARSHGICAHTWSHPHLTCLSNEQLFAELYFSSRIIEEVVGVRPNCFRPPYGDMVRSSLLPFANARPMRVQDDRVRYVAQQLGLRAHRWNADTDDWQVATTGEAAVVANYGARQAIIIYWLIDVRRAQLASPPTLTMESTPARAP